MLGKGVQVHDMAWLTLVRVGSAPGALPPAPACLVIVGWGIYHAVNRKLVI